MSQRLQVLLDPAEFKEIRRLARAQKLTVAEWVRRALRAARGASSSDNPDQKLSAIRMASRNSFPTADIEQMLAEIEQGYSARDAP